MECRYEEYVDERFEITRGFSCQNKLFYTIVIYKNRMGKPYATYEKVDKPPQFYRRIDAQGRHSEKTFETFYGCLLYHGVSPI